PLVTAALLAMLLLPMVRHFEKWKLGKFFSIFFSLMIVIGIVTVVIYILLAQIVSFTEDLPIIQEKLNQRFAALQQWVGSVTGLTGEEQLSYLQKSASSFLGLAQSFAGTILAATTGTVVFIGLVLVLIFLFLFYRGRIRIFLLHVLPEE